MKRNDPLSPQEAGARTKELRRVGLMYQDISAHHTVKRRIAGEGVKLGASEINVSKPAAPYTLVRYGDGICIAVNPDHGPGRADEFGGEDRHITGAASEVEHPHSLADAGRMQQPLSGWAQYVRLRLQTPDFRRRVTKYIFWIRRRNRLRAWARLRGQTLDCRIFGWVRHQNSPSLRQLEAALLAGNRIDGRKAEMLSVGPGVESLAFRRSLYKICHLGLPNSRRTWRERKESKATGREDFCGLDYRAVSSVGETP
jgi:hypothetical protein